MAELAAKEHERKRPGGEFKTPHSQFDEMETFEHTRLKPLSVALAVDAITGHILATSVAQMNYHGRLSAIARFKYGNRKDTRPQVRAAVFKKLVACTSNPLLITTDQKSDYAVTVKRFFADARHHQVVKEKSPDKTYRPNVNDALFRINHTAAKIRHDLSRMARRVWVTTKKASRLKAHLDLYTAYNNGYDLSF